MIFFHIRNKLALFASTNRIINAQFVLMIVQFMDEHTKPFDESDVCDLRKKLTEAEGLARSSGQNHEAAVLHDSLLKLAKFYPLNPIDVISQNPITKERQVVIASGHQFNILLLHKWFRDKKAFLNPLTPGLLFSPPDITDLKQQALEKGIVLPLDKPHFASSFLFYSNQAIADNNAIHAKNLLKTIHDLYNQGQLDLCLRLLNRLIEQYPNHIEAHLLSAKININKGYLASGLNHFCTIKHDSLLPRDDYNLAQSLVSELNLQDFGWSTLQKLISTSTITIQQLLILSDHQKKELIDNRDAILKLLSTLHMDLSTLNAFDSPKRQLMYQFYNSIEELVCHIKIKLTDLLDMPVQDMKQILSHSTQIIEFFENHDSEINVESLVNQLDSIIKPKPLSIKI